jgi:elongation factor Ts
MLIEINSQTDFVAMSDSFIELSNQITEAIYHAYHQKLEDALKVKTANGMTVDEACTQLTAKLGEKTSVRRFVFVDKQKDQSFVHYIHSNNKIGVLLLLGPDANLNAGRDVAMHAAAMAPKFLNKSEVDQA